MRIGACYMSEKAGAQCLAQELLWEGSLTPMTCRAPQGVVSLSEIGVGDASHSYFLGKAGCAGSLAGGLQPGAVQQSSSNPRQSRGLSEFRFNASD